MKIWEYRSDRAKIEEYINDRGFKLNEDIIQDVTKIINGVRKKGDNALFSYTKKFDEVDLESLTIEKTEIDEAYQIIDNRFLNVIKKAAENIRNFHKKQISQSWIDNKQGSLLGQLVNPIDKIGAYVPGGKASYPSSVLMSVIPAQIAGVNKITIVTPPDKKGNLNPYTLVAADFIGVDHIYKVGGAQAVAGLAYGTETISRVDKIVGPGNIYVTMAKKQVYGKVDIDMLAGPSEVLILADKKAKPKYIAADLLAQAEHDSRAVPILITISNKIIKKVRQEVEKQLEKKSAKPGSRSAQKSLERNGLIIKVDNISEGLRLTNQIAPEHFELMVEDPLSYLGKVKNAGAVFLGENTPEPVGDYIAGPNHILPTGGTARYSSPLTVNDFVKKSSIVYYNNHKLDSVKEEITTLAELEGLTAHARSVRKRFVSDNEKKGGF